MPIEIKLEQRSEAWTRARSKTIGSSEVSSILGTNPWRTARQVWEEKLGLSEGVKMNSAMQRGVDFEDEARALLESKINLKFTPKVFRHDTKEFMQVSLDGITDDGKTICEIKCPTSTGLRDYAKSGKVPPYYESQIDYQLRISGAENAIFFVWYSSEESYVVPYSRNIEREIEVENKVVEFWEKYVLTKTPPPSKEDEYVTVKDSDWERLATEYINVKTQIKDLEFKLADIEGYLKEIIKRSGAKKVKGAGLRASEVSRVGAVNYGTIPQLIGVDLNKFRKPGTNYFKFEIGE
jgi:putative phage-type endonuclease